MKKNFKSLILCLAIVFSAALIPVQPTYAASCTSADADASFLSFPKWNRGLECKNVGEKTEHVDMDNTDIPTFIWTVVLNGLDILLRIAGILAVVLIIVNGYQYLTSAGSSDKISKAKTGLLQAIVGLSIALLSSTIIYFIIGRV
jgi:hypothetical protein